MKLRIKPSAKVKRRYLLLNSNNKKEIEKTILDYIGILGWTKSNPSFVKQDSKTILAVETKSLNEVRAAFELSGNIKILKVSGTLKSLK